MISQHERELMDERDRRSRQRESERRSWSNFNHKLRQYERDMHRWEKMSLAEREEANHEALRISTIHHSQVGYLVACAAVIIMLPTVDLAIRLVVCVVLGGVFYVVAVPLGRLIRASVRGLILGGIAWVVGKFVWSESPLLMEWIDRPIFSELLAAIGVAAAVAIEIFRGSFLEPAEPRRPWFSPTFQRPVKIVFAIALMYYLNPNQTQTTSKKAPAQPVKLAPLEQRIAGRLEKSLAKELTQPVQVLLVVAANGDVLRAKIATSTGNPDLDKRILSASVSVDASPAEEPVARRELAVTLTPQLVTRHGTTPKKN